MLRFTPAVMLTSVGVALALLAGAAPASADTDLRSLGEQSKIKVLQDGTAVFRAAPGPNGHRYSYVTTSARWSVIATEPQWSLDTTLQLFDDKSMTQLLGQSTYGSDMVDFVTVDSTHRALGSYYPRVSSPFKYYDYNIEQVQGFGAVLDGSYPIPMGVRALQDGFRRDLSTSPSAYLRDVRMKQAHAQLQVGDPTRTTVTQVALRCGFLHLGRFSVDYRRRFGRSPSQTLASH